MQVLKPTYKNPSRLLNVHKRMEYIRRALEQHFVVKPTALKKLHNWDRRKIDIDALRELKQKTVP